MMLARRMHDVEARLTSEQPASCDILTRLFVACQDYKRLYSRNTRTVKVGVKQYLRSVREKLRHRPWICDKTEL